MISKGGVTDNSPFQGSEIPYKLYRRFLSLTDSLMTLSETLRHVDYVRFKPLFVTYNSCEDEALQDRL